MFIEKAKVQRKHQEDENMKSYPEIYTDLHEFKLICKHIKKTPVIT